MYAQQQIFFTCFTRNLLISYTFLLKKRLNILGLFSFQESTSWCLIICTTKQTKTLDKMSFFAVYPIRPDKDPSQNPLIYIYALGRIFLSVFIYSRYTFSGNPQHLCKRNTDSLIQRFLHALHLITQKCVWVLNIIQWNAVAAYSFIKQHVFFYRFPRAFVVRWCRCQYGAAVDITEDWSTSWINCRLANCAGTAHITAVARKQSAGIQMEKR